MELTNALRLEKKFDSVEQLYSASQKVTNLVSNQKYNEINEISENHKFKTIMIEHEPIAIDFEVPYATISNKEEYSRVVNIGQHQFLLKICPNSTFDKVFNVALEDMDETGQCKEYISKM